MRAQSAVIGVMLFFVSMIIMGAVFLGIVSKTIKLLDAGRMEIEFLTRKAQERIEVRWGWDMVSGTEGYPKLIINNTGPVPVEIVQVRLSVREKYPGRYQWPFIVRGPWIIAGNKTIPVGGSLVVKSPHRLNRKQIEDWYRDNMTRILEARILTTYGNLFRTVYVPIKPPSPSNSVMPNAILFYWSAVDWMDIENQEWWHGDLLGYYKMTTPDDAWGIAGGNIEIPKWYTDSSKTVEFRFMAYLPGLDSDGYVAGTDNFLVLAVEYIDRGQSGPYPASVKTKFELSIKDLEGNTVYTASSQEVTDPGGTRTAYFKLDPGNPKFVIIDLHDEALDNTPKSLEPGWYIIELKITFSRVRNSGSVWLGLKSVFLYISSEKLW